MASENKNSNSEISVGAQGVTMKGELADEIRLPIRRIAKTADAVLRLMDNLVGLPADYLSTQLERFRDKYREEISLIPEDKRQTPPLRLGCAVLSHVAYATEEPEIQDLFAKLLATASNINTKDKAHPGFASVISDLTPYEAKLLVALHDLRRPVLIGHDDWETITSQPGHEDMDLAQRAVSNLIRLGLLEWVVLSRGHSIVDINKIAGKSHYYFDNDPRTQTRLLHDAVKDIQNMKKELMAMLQKNLIRKQLIVSSFGQQFIEACLPRN